MQAKGPAVTEPVRARRAVPPVGDLDARIDIDRPIVDQAYEMLYHWTIREMSSRGYTADIEAGVQSDLSVDRYSSMRVT